MNAASGFDTSFRLLGLIPLGVFLASAQYHWSQGKAAEMLWVCQVSTLALSLGMFFAQPLLIRCSTVWLLIGLPLWLMYLLGTDERPWQTFATHLVGLGVGLFALRRARFDGHVWWQAFTAFLVLQAVCRWATPADLNVNVAHRPYEGWEKHFPYYSGYWLFTTGTAVVVLWVLGLVLQRLFPAASAGS